MSFIRESTVVLLSVKYAFKGAPIHVLMYVLTVYMYMLFCAYVHMYIQIYVHTQLYVHNV